MSAWIARPNWLFQESYGLGGAFTEYSLPEAILKLRQGVGRLIRTKRDHGIVVILDNRIVTRPYPGVARVSGKSDLVIAQTAGGTLSLRNTNRVAEIRRRYGDLFRAS